MSRRAILLHLVLAVIPQAGANGAQDAPSTQASDTNAKVSQLTSGDATYNDVVRLFGEPKSHFLEKQTFTKNDLPQVYIMGYQDGFSVVMEDGRVSELRFEGPAAGYVHEGKLRIGSPLGQVLDVVGKPTETIAGVPRAELGRKAGALYRDIGGQKGYCYYNPAGKNVRFFFADYKVSALYVTIDRSGLRRGQALSEVQEFQDVRSKDLSKLDLSGQAGLLHTLTFNQQTAWPPAARMPKGKAPEKLLEDAMSPGLGVRGLHQKGITGKGVHVAIIDQPLHPDHPEFAGKIVEYHDVGCDSASSMHGPAVASLLVGAKCGTAPDARVLYVAAPSWTKDTAYQARALDWIVEQNRQRPASQKIRAVSVSAAPSGPGTPFEKNTKMWDEACARAEAEGILVLDCTSHHGFIGACWYDATDPEDPGKCTPGFPGRSGQTPIGHILVPSSPRTTAEESDKGEFGYQYWGRGESSWTIPYCAGVLALGWQINPELSGQQMRELLFKSAYVRKADQKKIINPESFIRLVEKAEDGETTVSPVPQELLDELDAKIQGVLAGRTYSDESKALIKKVWSEFCEAFLADAPRPIRGHDLPAEAGIKEYSDYVGKYYWREGSPDVVLEVVAHPSGRLLVRYRGQQVPAVKHGGYIVFTMGDIDSDQPPLGTRLHGALWRLRFSKEPSGYKLVSPGGTLTNTLSRTPPKPRIPETQLAPDSQEFAELAEAKRRRHQAEMEGTGQSWLPEGDRREGNRTNILEDLRALEELGDAAAAWLTERGQANKAKVGELLEKLLADEPTAKVCFGTAQIAWLCGDPKRAIKILEDASAKYGSATDRGSATGIVTPINVQANYWIGSIARRSGDRPRAIEAYETVVALCDALPSESWGPAPIMALMYLAEMDSASADTRSQAIDRLAKAIEIVDAYPAETKVKERGAQGLGFFRDWLEYERAVLKQGKMAASDQLTGHREYLDACMWAASELQSSGVLHEVKSSLRREQNSAVFYLAPLERLIQEGKSPIDRTLARLAFAFGRLKEESFAEADQYSLAVFEEGSFFSPVGGLLLAYSKIKQGKSGEADEILERVKARFPGYAQTADELAKTWQQEQSKPR